ncbi:CCCH zinc finger domain protein [Cordyceps fumosorosea ARSEF 2679]|uniref:CCCH zinc finger domain protein n=1 Tax=Cordyceps fumosorosea (strain ARSEF 2679) TaxID=1081104 RepID=A0A162IEM8_CORFA|nr:CCCH zinc finger domain protein [Cordyceps fumosorosea ARSEF 2679]OAA56065.1 CCCH zinc finger domain protein [Cordyceps fumosorosea ARSEF 2679]
MTLCKFFQQGTCRFGNSCRFEHPTGGQASSNRFGALGGGSNAQFQRSFDKYSIKLDVIETDLTTETPTWILSAYAPGRDAPDQLFGGAMREQSFEEMRLHYMKGKAEGNEQRALAEAQELYQKAQAQMQAVVSNVSEAAKYVVEGENRHPNRFDICQQGTQGAPFGEFLVGKRPKSIAPEQPANPFASNTSTLVASANPFATNSTATNASSPFGGSAAPTTTTSAFGQPSAPGQKPNPFGTPAFGQTAQPAPGFGGQPATQPSAFGQPAAQPSAFGQPAQQKPNPFGQAAPTQPSAFGQPSTLGAKPSPFGAPAFGQTAQAGGAQTSAFGQPSQLGQKPNPFGGNANAGPSPFATAAASNNNAPANPFAGNSNAGPSPFAATSNNNQQPAANPFGAPSTNQPVPNPFGSQPPTQNQNANPFGQPSATPAANPLGSNAPSSTPAGNPFATGGQQAGSGGNAAPNPFAAAQSNTNAAPNLFAAAQSNANAPNPFAAAPANQAQPAAVTAAQGGNPYPPGSAKQHPAAESYTSRNMDGTLAAFKGKAVTYNDGKPGVRAFDGTWTRIWFPDGPPAYYKDTEAAAYDQASTAQWKQFEQTGKFADGVMPSVPPPRECTVWDF